MRIAFVTEGFFPLVVGGMERHTTMLCNEWAKFPDISLTVFAAGEKPSEIPKEIEFHSIFVPVAKQAYPKFLWNYSLQINRLLEHEDFDFIYCQGLSAIHIRHQAPVIYNPHGLEMFQQSRFSLWLKTAPLRWMARKCFESSEKVICLGGELKKILLDNGCPEEKILFQPNGINLSYIECQTKALGLKRQPKRFFFVGRLEPIKGAATLLEAFGEIRDPEATLMIGGAGSLSESLRKKFSHDPRIVFLGKLTEEELYREFLLADAFVFPSHSDGMPTVLMEAMACNRPVIATDVGAAREIVKEGTGILVKPDDKKDLKGALDRFLTLTDYQKQAMGHSGYRHVAAHFNWPQIARESLNQFKELAKSREYSVVA